MTTTVTIKTHDWPVQVTAVDRRSDGSLAYSPLTTVPPHSETPPHGLCLHDSRDLIITEMKAPRVQSALG